MDYNIDINSFVAWQQGMKLKASTFIGHDRRIERKLKSIVSVAMGRQTGLIVDSVFDVHPVIAYQNIEIERCRCSALLSSGLIIDTDEKVKVPLASFADGNYYLAVTLTDNQVMLNCEYVEYIRPEYSYSIMTLNELKEKNAFPIVKLSVNEGRLTIDSKYIVPQLNVGNSKLLMDYAERIAGLLSKIAWHPNIDPLSEMHGAFMYLTQRLLDVDGRWQVSSWTSMLYRVVAQVVWYMADAKGCQMETLIDVPDVLDLYPWLEDVVRTLENTYKELDDLKIERRTIDVSKLREDLYNELYEKLHDSLYEKLKQELQTYLLETLSDSLKQTVRSYIDDDVVPAAKENITQELANSLSVSLYDKLYKALYDALYVPTTEEDFVPLI